MSRRFIYWLLLTGWTQGALAAVALLPVTVDLNDSASLQRGAKLFMNYCSGCHSLRYMRYNRLASDLGLTTEDGAIDKSLLVNNLIFTTAKIHDPIEISMPQADARQWFGMPPPDLSLIAREHSPSWLYTYLNGFYVDKTRPFGGNNLLVPDVGMPNVLAPLKGEVKAVSQKDGTYLYDQLPPQLVVVKPGEMSGPQFDRALCDLVTFLVYVAEPTKLIRIRIGIFVMLYLALFLVVAYQLNKFYWRKIS